MINYMRTIAALSVLVILPACNDRVAPMSVEKKGVRELQPQHAVVPQPGTLANLSPEERTKRERATIDAILTRTPSEHRSQMRSLLENTLPGRDIAVASSTDPEIAQLLGVLVSLRQADLAANRVLATASVPAEDTIIHVLLALVPKLDAPGARATVIRRPSDSGTPLVLLQEDSVTKEDLAIAMRAATVAFRRYGSTLATERRLAIRGGNRPPKGVSAVSDINLEKLKKAAFMEIPGIGKVRAREVVTNLSSWR